MARDLGQALLALTFAAACGGSTSVGTSSPTPATVFDEHFGVLIGNTVRAEGGPQALFSLPIASESGGVVSPDGRRLAYWAGNELRVIGVARDAQPRTLLSITDGEAALYFAWSSDGTGIVVGVNGGGGGQGDAPPGYTALRAVDVAGGAPREIVRIKNANVVPLAWDRKAHLIAAYEPIASGTYNYDLVSEDGTVKQTPPMTSLYFLEASHDAQQVFGHVNLPSTALRVWPVASYEKNVDLTVPAGQHILAVRWRPGSTEIGILFPDRLELWDASGARRTFAVPPTSPSSDRSASLVFRADGKAALVGRRIESSPGTLETYTVAIDLATGRNAVVQWPGDALEPGRSVRVAP